MGAPNPNIYHVNYRGVKTNLTPPNHRTPRWLAWLNVLLYPLQWLHNYFFNDYANGSNYPFYNSSNSYTVGANVIDIDNAAYQLTLGGQYVTGFTISSGGSGYVNPLVVISGGGGQGATATATVDTTTGKHIIAITLTNYGYGYTTAPTVTITDSSGSGASVTAIITTAAPPPHLNVANGIWVLINPDYRGVRPRTNFNGQKIVLEAILNQFFRTTFRQPSTLQQPDIHIVNNQNYLDTIFVAGYNEGASSVAVYGNNQAINFVEYSNASFNFNDPCFTIYVPSSLYFSISGGTPIALISMGNSGNGYGSVPTVVFTGGGGTGAAGTARLGTGAQSGMVVGVVLTNPGTGYTSLPTIGFTGGSPSVIATAFAVATNTTQGDNTIKATANRYVIAGMTYNIQPY